MASICPYSSGEAFFNSGDRCHVMSEHTARDAVWSQALQYALAENSFSIENLQDTISEDVSDGTVHDTLSTMAEKKWLSKESSQGQVWTAGPRLQDKPNVKDEKNKENSEAEDFEEDEVIPLSECEVSTPSDLSTDKVYVGVVDRVTGSSGNAIVNIAEGNGEINLGPIDESAEGEEVHFRPEDGIWGRCLDEEYTYESYDPRDGASRSSTKSRKFSQNPYKRSGSSKTTGPDDPDNLNKLLTGHQ